MESFCFENTYHHFIVFDLDMNCGMSYQLIPYTVAQFHNPIVAVLNLLFLIQNPIVECHTNQ